MTFANPAAMITLAFTFVVTPHTEFSNGQPACMALHEAHDAMNMRGEYGMGFSQTETAHHFLLTETGGVIEVFTKEADENSRDEIRMHLTHIAKAFASGNFDIPMFIHETVPPGVPEMKRLQNKIHYSFEETANGGRVVITTADGDALNAIHKFLQFQIDEHRTGDPR
jgi:hypothetical protein